MNNKSNEIWMKESNFDNWELRKHRFPEEACPLFYQYLGVTPESYILDGGCGTGVFTRYLAGGLRTGKVIGFDISRHLIDYGNQKIAEENLTEVCQLIEADGFNLPFEDNTFDAVTNYTYLGVLSDPEAGLKEMIRVCRKGGIVSAPFAATRAGWNDEYEWKGSDRLKELINKQEEIFQKHILKHNYYRSSEWPDSRYPTLFDRCGLKDIHIYSVSSAFSLSDSRWPEDYRRYQINGIGNEIRMIKERRLIKEYEDFDFTDKEFNELIELLEQKRDCLLKNINSNNSFNWEAWLTVIVTGMK